MSKGAKKPLSQLSRQMPTGEQFAELMSDLERMEDRAAALISTAMVDNFLEIAINRNFIELDPQSFESLFRGPISVLSPYGAKNAIAYALGVYGETMKRQLGAIGAIRNAFAHTALPITFDHPVIAKECRKLDPAALSETEYRPEADTPKERFSVTTQIVMHHLMNYIGRQDVVHAMLGKRQTSPDKFSLHRPRSPHSQDESE